MELHRIILPYRKRDTVNFEQGHALAEAIVDTVREPLLVLDHNLRVVAASRSFYLTFRANRQEVQGRLLYALGDGQWDIPQLRTALETIIFTEEPLEAFEVDQDFPSIGRRTMVLNARRVHRSGGKIHQILLAIEDVTERTRLEREHALAHERVALLMKELTHRVKNSLQSIAAMVMIEARSHKTSEGKAVLERVSHRIDALGQLYAKLSRSDAVEAVDAATYLDDLCRELVASTQKRRHVDRAQDRHRKRTPADGSGHSDGSYCERARHERPQVCFSERYKRHCHGGAQAGLWGASSDGRRQRQGRRHATRRLRARRATGGRLRGTARRPD